MRSRESSITCNVVNTAKYLDVYLCINDLHVENSEYSRYRALVGLTHLLSKHFAKLFLENVVVSHDYPSATRYALVILKNSHYCRPQTCRNLFLIFLL